MKKIIGIIVLVFVLLVACVDDDETESVYIGNDGDPNQTWAVYLYLCGSDLESEVGAASEDINEILEVSLPENVKVVIETGGTSMWNNDFCDPSYIQRYVYEGDEMSLVDEEPLENMGESETLADFLWFCKENYKADKTAVVLWNHGGGSVGGVSYDENFGYDSLALNEIYDAFDSVYDLSTEEPPVELIGFDACLMASVDTAYMCSDIAKYMVASEEMEPGCGWNYSGFLQKLADNPAADGVGLGQYICDSYEEGCDMYWAEDEITLSVTDLSKMQDVVDAYDYFGSEALSYALDDPYFFSEFGRIALDTENYGGNTRDQGYGNMVDLGHLASNCYDIMPDSYDMVTSAIDEAVLYKINGIYRENASGLSCYYSYDSDTYGLNEFYKQGVSDAFKYLYEYAITGSIGDDGLYYVENAGHGTYEPHDVAEVPDLCLYEDMEYPVYLNENGMAVLELDPDIADMLTSISFQLAYVDEDDDFMIMLGEDNDIVADWDEGVFTDNFRGVWGAIDDCLVYMEVVYETEDDTTYSVPVLLNGEEYSLIVVYDFNYEEFFIIGATRGIDDSGMASKDLRKLQVGDEITTIHYASSMYGDDDFVEIPVDTIIVDEDTSFDEVDLGDGVFVMMFELTDTKNNTAYSQMISITVDGDYAETEIIE